VYAGNARAVTKGVEYGLFSKVNIHKGETVFIAKGERYTEVVNDLKASMNHRNAIGIAPDTWLDPFETDPLRYVNHSCDPNMGIKGKVTFVALRDIHPHEHITIDYSITECDTLWNFKIQTGSNCKCGAKKCRVIIRSIQFLPVDIYKKYLPYIPTAFQKVYMKAHGTL
jgi:SET domain-containing protein